MPKNPNQKNTFRFKHFEELIQVDILLKKHTKLDENEESYLAECFNKWTTLNCSLEFAELRRKLGPKILTLSLLLINEEEVINILFEYIEKCSSLSVSSLLDLLQSLVCDIRADFLPYLERSFSLITSLIERSNNDAEMLLSAFNCIAHILVFLEAPLIKNLQRLFPLIKPLLFHPKKHYIRNFSAQSLAYLLRKSRDFKKLFQHSILIDLVDGDSHNHVDATGKLMSACLRIQDSLYRTADKMFVAFFELLMDPENPRVEFLVACFDTMFQQLLNRLDIQGYRGVWRLLVKQICAAPQGNDELPLLVMELFFKHAHNRTLVECAGPVLDHVKKLLQRYDCDGPLTEAANKVIEIVKLLIHKLPSSLEGIQYLVRAVMKCRSLSIENKFQFVQDYWSNGALEMAIKTGLNNYLSTNVTKEWLQEDPNNLNHVLRAMTKLVMVRHPANRESVTTDPSDNDQNDHANMALFVLDSENHALPEALLATVSRDTPTEMWMTCIVVPHMYLGRHDAERFSDALTTVFESLVSSCMVASHASLNSVLLDMDAVLWCLLHLSKSNAARKTAIQVDTVASLMTAMINVLSGPDCSSELEPIVLDIIQLVLRLDNCRDCFKGLPKETRDQWHVLLMAKLQSPIHRSRLNAIRVLQTLTVFWSTDNNDADTVSMTTSECLSICEQIELLLALPGPELATKERTITRLVGQLTWRADMETSSIAVATRYLTGALHVQLSSLWRRVEIALVSYEQHETLWPVLEGVLDHCASRDVHEKGDMEIVENGDNEDEQEEDEAVDDDCSNSNVEEQDKDEEEEQDENEDEDSEKESSPEMERDCAMETCDGLRDQYCETKFETGRTADWLMYRHNVVRLIGRIPDLAGRKTAVLSPLLLDLFTREVLSQRPPRRLRENTFTSLLELFGRLPNPSGIHSEPAVRILCLRCLASSRVPMQRAALIALSNLRNPEIALYRERIVAGLLGGESNKCKRSANSSEVRSMALSTVAPAHRAALVPILVRIVVGKMHALGSTGAASKHRKALVGFLLELEHTEVPILLSIVMEALATTGDRDEPLRVLEPNTDISTVSDAAKTRLETGVTRGLAFYVIQAVVKGMRSVVRSLRDTLDGLLNKLSDDHLVQILRVVLDMYASCAVVKANSESVAMENSVMDTDDRMIVDDDNQNSIVANDVDMDTGIVTKKQIHHEQAIPMSQLKALRQECASIILLYFEKIIDNDYGLHGNPGSSWATEEVLGAVWKVVVAPQVDSLASDNLSSANTTVLLMLLWSRNKVLAGRMITSEIFDHLVQLLRRPKLKREAVGFRIVSIVYNVLGHSCAPVDTGDNNDNENQLSWELRRLVRTNLADLMSYLAVRVQSVKAKRLQPTRDDKAMLNLNETNTTRKELLMIPIAVRLLLESDDGTNNAQIDTHLLESMIKSIFMYLNRTNKQLVDDIKDATNIDKDENQIRQDAAHNDIKEQLEVDFLRALDSIMSIVDTGCVLDYFEQLLGLFSRLHKRASRTVLSNLVAGLWKRIVPNLDLDHGMNKLGNVALKLNSWNEKRLEEMDSDLISITIQEVTVNLKATPVQQCCSGTVLKGSRFPPAMWLYLLTAHNCLFLLTEVPEIGTRQIATDFVDALIRDLASCQNKSEYVHTLVFDVLWPLIKRGIDMKHDSFRNAFIELAQTMIRQFPESERFSDIAQLAIGETDQMSFFDNMLSLTTAFNSRGLRQLVRFLSGHVVSTRNTKEVLLPLVMHYLGQVAATSRDNRATVTHAQRNSLAATFDALTAVAKQLSYKEYQRLVNLHMFRLTKGREIELKIKTLIAVLNGLQLVSGDKDYSTRVEFIVPILGGLEGQLSKRLPSDIRHKYAQKGNNIVNAGAAADNSEWTTGGVALQVPLALAIVNIAVKLPQKHLEESVTRVVLRICDFLKAREPKVRKEASATLFRIVEILHSTTGEPKDLRRVRFLGLVVQTVRSHLERGFQRYVALNTCHRILQRLVKKNVFSAGGAALEQSTVRHLSEMYLDELFGGMAREKAERIATEKLIIAEAKNVKAFKGFRMIAGLLEPDQLTEFMNRIVEATKSAKCKTKLGKLQQLLDAVLTRHGLVSNSRLSEGPVLFTFSMMLIQDHWDNLIVSETAPSYAPTRNKPINQMESLHLYVPGTRLDGNHTPRVQVGQRSAAHLFVHGALGLLHGLCKHHSDPRRSQLELAPMVGPLVPKLLEILTKAQHNSIVLSGLKLLLELLRINPTSLSESINRVKDVLFKLHHKRVGLHDVKDEEKETISRVFNKTVTELVCRSDVKLTPGQCKVLLLGIQLDSLNEKRQMSSFNLLRAFIENRVKSTSTPENEWTGETISLAEQVKVNIPDIITRVRNMALISSYEKTRTEARETVILYWKCHRLEIDELQELVVFLSKNLVELDEDGQLSIGMLLQALMKEYSALEIGLDSISPGVLACILLALTNRIGAERIELALLAIFNQIMMMVSADKQLQLAELLFSYFSKFELYNARLRAAFLMAAEVPKCLLVQRDFERWARKLVDAVMGKLPELTELSTKLYAQQAASKGEDSELMNELESTVAADNKRNKCRLIGKKHGDSESEKEEEHEGNMDHDGWEQVEADNGDGDEVLTSEQISERLTSVMDNVRGSLRALSRLLELDFSVGSDVGVFQYLVETGHARGYWSLVVERLVRSQHSLVRLEASRLIVQPLLSASVRFETGFPTASLIERLIVACFCQLRNENLAGGDEECDTVVLNLVAIWHLLQHGSVTSDDDVKTRLCKRVVNKANIIAKDELLAEKSLVRRCAVLKLMAGICSKTGLGELRALELDRSFLYMWLREDRQLQDTRATRKRQNEILEKHCSEHEIEAWKGLVVSVGEVIKQALGDDSFKALTLLIGKERASNKLKRKIAESALAVSNPGQAVRKKLRRANRNRL